MSQSSCCGVRRVVQPQYRQISLSKECADAKSGLLSKIDAFYTEASERLAVRARPVTLARFLNSGFCIGLLDPVSNIIANTVCTSDLRPETVLVGTIGDDRCPDIGEKFVVGTTVVAEKMEKLGRRSLEGLVAFLIYFFPYLAKWEAVRYLLLADADLLAAAVLIVADRGMTRFSLTSPSAAPAFEEALTLAAQVAKHSQPTQLAELWMSISSGLLQAMTMLLDVQSHSPRQNLEALETLPETYGLPNLAVPWDLATSRLHHCIFSCSIAKSMPHEFTRSLPMVLLDTIHGFYLKALAMLPGGELRSRLHRSLLGAGHCYGPMDPVSNIILNTLWYDANFPGAAETIPVLNVIGPRSLTRLVIRSFYGLVSFLQTRYHDLSEQQIVRCLVAASAQLSIADPNLMCLSDIDLCKRRHYQCCIQLMPSFFFDAIRKIDKASPCADVLEAYAAAATAAWHCKPEEQAKFLASWEQRRPIPRGSSIIDSTDVQCWSSLILSEAKPGAPERVCNTCYSARAGRARSMNLQRKISRKVKAVLDRLLLDDLGKPMFDLHIICCVNEYVCGPEYCEDIDPLAFAPCKYRYSHVNFMATKRDNCKYDVTLCQPVLFFAEFDNEEEDGAPLVLCKVDHPTPFAEHVRCLYCECEGARVVHPPCPKFHGGGCELQEVIRGERGRHGFDEHMGEIEGHAQHLCGLDEDFMYVDVKNYG